MHTNIIIAIQKNETLNGMEKSVMLALAIHCNPERNGQCNPGIPLLMKDTGWSRAPIIRALNRLKKRGLVHSTPHSYTHSNQYILTIDGLHSGGIAEIPERYRKDTRVVSQKDQGGVAERPKVRSEVIKEVINEVKEQVHDIVNSKSVHKKIHKTVKQGKDLAQKIDELMDKPIAIQTAIFYTNGKPDPGKLATCIMRRDGLRNCHPSRKMIATVQTCIDYNLLQKKKSA